MMARLAEIVDVAHQNLHSRAGASGYGRSRLRWRERLGVRHFQELLPAIRFLDRPSGPSVRHRRYGCLSSPLSPESGHRYTDKWQGVLNRHRRIGRRVWLVTRARGPELSICTCLSTAALVISDRTRIWGSGAPCG